MNPQELKSICKGLFGPRWQTPLANALGVAFRTVQRWSSGKITMPEGAASAVRALDRHDEWIVGDGVETGVEFIIHTRWPRFIARVATDTEDFNISGLTYGASDDTTICEFVWSDAVPDEAALLTLLQRADAALELAGLDGAESLHSS